MREPDEGRAAEVARLTALFADAGARRVEPGYLQPAETLLDLYGEDIRARAYRTDDPVHGEQMLRPDFTVPVVEMHVEAGAETARYAYAGPVWRRQEWGDAAPREFWQVGYELFDASAATADAEVFALFSEAVGARAAPVTGDLGLIFAAIDALGTSDLRKAALRRHVWRPKRFQRLMERFAGQAPFDIDQRIGEISASEAPEIGLRSRADCNARLSAIREDLATDPLSTEEVALITTLLAIRGGASACLAGVDALSRSFSGLSPRKDLFEARLEALAAKGIDVAALPFDAAQGRATMEYYDGFTFAFTAPDGTPVATGGRYDALTEALARRRMPAVGGIIRPGLLARLG